ncbi:MAG: hypothetical protein D6729_10625 [Deltaproteobacteria bacterium]|nr:MAG: hypothetical protein D6729_10625 [Deltaproteobacteria bacterium]
MRRGYSSRLGWGAVLGLAVLLLAACVEQRGLEERLASFRVNTTSARGSAESPIPFPESPLPIDVTIVAISNKGRKMSEFNGEVAVFATPGRAHDDRFALVRVPLVAGEGSASLFLSKVYGKTYVCVEDRYRGPESTYAVGCSPTFYVDMPAIAQMQRTEDVTTSPLTGSFIEIRKGDLIVTGVFAEGFFVQDLEAEPDPMRPGTWGGLFVYSFSFPDGLSMGDRVSSIIGTVQEFTGTTQLVFPSWTRVMAPKRLEDLPAPVEITSELCAATGMGDNGLMCGQQDNLDLESLESSVVVVRRVRTPTTWVDCDFNKDGDVPNYDPNCSDGDERTVCREIACKAMCNLDPTCSELSGYETYGQWAVTLDEGAGPKINVLTREGVPEFDPLDPANQGILIDVSGNLRHSLPARPRWVVLARTPEDLVRHP